VGLVKARLARSLLRLFTVQGSWNYERMLGLGMGVATEPLLRDLPNSDGGATYRAAVARAAHFFNAHPYLCGLAVGAAARAEHEGAPPDHIERLRTALCGPLGAIGDRLVWAGWLPCVSALAVAALGLGARGWAVVGFLLVYNAGHLALRWWALRAGWNYGTRVAVALHHPVLLRAQRAMGAATALAAGVCLPLAARSLAVPFRGWVGGAVVLAAGACFLTLRLLPGRLTGHRLGLLVVATALLAGWVWP